MHESPKDCLSCSNSFSEPAENDNEPDILYWILKPPKDCLSCSNSFSEPAENDDEPDILHCMLKDSEVVPEDGYCEDYN